MSDIALSARLGIAIRMVKDTASWYHGAGSASIDDYYIMVEDFDRVVDLLESIAVRLRNEETASGPDGLRPDAPSKETKNV